MYSGLADHAVRLLADMTFPAGYPFHHSPRCSDVDFDQSKNSDDKQCTSEWVEVEARHGTCAIVA